MATCLPAGRMDGSPFLTANHGKLLLVKYPLYQTKLTCFQIANCAFVLYLIVYLL
ncbi:MAG: hypothetical protein OQK52_10870 [Ignavibacteriaceae bacterium]|nr:hypothetical protein [Ignavibacteriaceae bacterium]MCW8812228.1 hypothetical protein [Chlorobium sp.]MCW8818363.1 hypothetical protein [Ignavibacteriaceae bacterium]MCW8824031.1 hypothetical protein [Ignavibacteriaceae bacterium]MCW8961618.1 hypothetical protein [Ignavibacteriaceae bacterium]